MKQQMGAWRLVESGALEGPANMALDEALLESFSQRASGPLLRLYGWRPAALSVGRYQDASSALDLTLCQADGIPVVRRMTGGGIIYHDQELTYSIVCSPAHLGDHSGVKDGFRLLCGFLLRAYRALGLEPAFAVDANEAAFRLGARTPLCFAGREAYDIVVQGKKVGGNAQRRKRDVIFQHGSIPLASGVARAVRYLREPAAEASQAASLEELGVAVPVGALGEALAAALEEELQVRLTPEPVTAQEAERAQRLLEEKYLVQRWNLEGEAPLY